jgi:hypothetical protein
MYTGTELILSCVGAMLVGMLLERWHHVRERK